MYLSSKNIHKLLNKNGRGTQLSIYLPTHPSSNSQTLAQDTTRLKNALKAIKGDPGYVERELGDTIKSLYLLVDNVDFWKQQDLGLAIFANSQGYSYYHLPYETTQETYIKDQFVISPLVVMHSIGTEYYVLDVNLTKPRLLKSRHGTLIEVEGTELPKGFEEIMVRDEYDVSLQNKAAPRGSGADNKFHGRNPADDLEHDTTQYLIMIAQAVDKALLDADRPLLLAGEESRVGNLRPHLKYSHVLEHSLHGNWEASTPQELHDLTFATIQEYESQQRKALVEQLLAAPPALVVMGTSEITEAASAGRVERMYVPAYKRTADSVRPGQAETIVLQLPNNIADLEQTTLGVLLQAGSVVAVEIGAFEGLDEVKALCRF